MDPLTWMVQPVDGADADVEDVLTRHHALMRSISPEESCHVMTAQALRDSGASVFALRDDTGAIAGVGALKPFGTAVELKSMHVLEARRGEGLGRVLLDHLLDVARSRSAQDVYLETGSWAEFDAARGLYAAAGFAECDPFGDYKPDPLSTFMHKAL